MTLNRHPFIGPLDPFGSQLFIDTPALFEWRSEDTEHKRTVLTSYMVEFCNFRKDELNKSIS